MEHMQSALSAMLNTDALLLGVKTLIVLVALGSGWLVYALLMHISKRVKHPFIVLLLPHICNACKWLLLCISLETALPALDFTALWELRLHHILYALMVAATGWIMTGVTLAGSQWLGTRYTWTGSEDNLRNRSIHTQLRIFTHVILFIIWLITIIAIIMTIPHLRSIGVSLFASAGVAGIVIGIAAGPALSNLIAGIQLALTQPVRIGDQIVVEGVSGIVEEIDSTYVVIKLWDLRRLIVPLNYFIQNRFQNWTHTRSESIIATVIFYVDFLTPIEPIRQELHQIAKNLPAWDGSVCTLRVTDLKDNKMAQLQISLSTRSAIHLFRLQCDLRERLLAFIQRPPAPSHA